MAEVQLSLPLGFKPSPSEWTSQKADSHWERLVQLLSKNLDFSDQDNRNGFQNLHSFPAKFPPQLPRLFIKELTQPGDFVLDPMQGSGTTIIEALIAGRVGIGIDIDPLSVLITQVKTVRLDPIKVFNLKKSIIENATDLYFNHSDILIHSLESRWESRTRRFIDYWFDKDTQLALMALLLEIEKIDDHGLRNFFLVAFSSMIVTKSGGVSLALDLAHTRPHRAKLIYKASGEILEGEEFLGVDNSNLKHSTKILRSPFNEFRKRVEMNIKCLMGSPRLGVSSLVLFGNAQHFPLANDSIDLIVTSPPYASNAIDYMRAHKFSLVWFKFDIDTLGKKRGEYIGSERINYSEDASLPDNTSRLISEIAKLDPRKGKIMQRYYLEMMNVLIEMERVLKAGKSSIIVIGSSKLRGRDIETQNCLAEIGEAIGFKVAGIGIRRINRNRRMMPTGHEIDFDSQIQQRMHEEYVIGFYKPLKK